MALPDLHKCICDSPGYCPVFNKVMGIYPPDWKWCQKTNIVNRQSYYDILNNSIPGTANSKYDSSVYCEYAGDEVKTIDWNIYKNTNFDNVQILCLGHSQKQFDTIKDRPYLKKINLNEIDAGKYSGNEWAESRAFISDKLFSGHPEYIGFVTASWNSKYESWSRIDEFHNWRNAKILINSKPEDKIILCADTFCACNWVFKIKDTHSILSTFFKHSEEWLAKSFSKLIGLDYNNHVRVPFSNQMILHRDLFYRYKNFLDKEQIFDKVEWFVSNVANDYKYNKQDELRNKYHYTRLNGYLMEMVTCLWFSNNDHIYLANAKRKTEWYSSNNVKRRIKEY